MAGGGGRRRRRTRKKKRGGEKWESRRKTISLLFKFEVGLAVEIAGIKLHLAAAAAAERHEDQSFVLASADGLAEVESPPRPAIPLISREKLDGEMTKHIHVSALGVSWGRSHDSRRQCVQVLQPPG